MLYSKLLGKTRKDAPKDAEVISHKLLTRAGFIDQLLAGVYTYLPLGWRTHQKIARIIREEMQELGAQELNMPTLQNKEQWLESGRWDTYDPPLFKFEDRHGRELALGPTHEEVITDLARRYINSYKELPISVFQIQNKFRNEMRPTGGLLRTREFYMKDLYSFHTSEKDLDEFYMRVVEAYVKIFRRLGLNVKVMEADPGSIGGTGSHEFGFEAESGEDTMFYCQNCDWAANIEKLNDAEIEKYRNKETAKCPECGGKVIETRNIENGHVFKQETLYTKKMGANFTDENGETKPMYTGCYGIGVGRLMATIAETSHDKNGLIWPENIAPYSAHLVGLDLNETAVNTRAFEVYNKLRAAGIEVLFDDRENVSAGEKFADADLIGIPYRLVVSKKTGDEVEIKRRAEEKITKHSLEKTLETLSS